MEKSTILRPTDDTQTLYKYVLEGKETTVSLSIEDDCIFSNADGEIDCPLDMILRKNKIDDEDLKKWQIADISFIEISGNVENLLRKIKCAMVLNILRS